MAEVTYIFYRENNNFEDILHDSNMIKFFRTKIQWSNHLLISSTNMPDDIPTYIMLKYGDNMIDANKIYLDRKPKPYIDYYPSNKRPKKFKDVYK